MMCAGGSTATGLRRFTPNCSGAIAETAARLMPADRARITRALEVVLATGRTIGDWHREGLRAGARSRALRARCSSIPSAPR